MSLRTFKPISDTKASFYNGTTPYIHWGGPFSVGLYNCISIFFLSDDNHSLSATIDGGGKFFLYTPSESSNNVRDCLSETATIHLDKYNRGQLIIACTADVEGEFITDLTVVTNGNEEYKYKIGAEFQAENEALSINLANNGIELPASIDKAIYGADPNEENPDWVLLNRKFKELLAHHIEVADNKGSYKSLLNSLKWFEYRDLVRLREVWKYNTPDGPKYYDLDLERVVDESTRIRMFNSSKTTSFVLDSLMYSVLNHPRRVGSTDEHVFEPQENGSIQLVEPNVPVLDVTEYDYDNYDDPALTVKIDKHTVSMWSEEELRFKIAALGYFYETYFMPIHTELMRSVVEDNGCFDVIAGGFGTNQAAFTSTDSETKRFNLTLLPPAEDYINPNQEYSYPIEEVHVYAGIDTGDAYGRAFEVDSSNSRMFWSPIIGCHDMGEPNATSSQMSKLNEWNGQTYSGLGAVVEMSFAFDSAIVSGELSTNQLGEVVTTTFDVPASSARNSFNAKLLFPNPGKFNLHFKFTGVDGVTYEQTKEVTITDTISPELHYYGLVAVAKPGGYIPNPWETPAPANYVTARDPESGELRLAENSASYYSDLLQNRQVLAQALCTNGVHWEVPYTTKVNIITWAGDGSEAALQRALPQLQQDHWIAVSRETDDSNHVIQTRIRYCNKQRGYSNKVPQNLTGELIEVDVFLPEVHKLVPIKDKVGQDTPIICRPEIRVGTDMKTLPYSQAIEGAAWEFYSYGLLKNICEIDRNILEPIVAPNDKVLPAVGYYKIVFNYSTVFGATRTIIDTPSWKIVPEHVEMSV